MSLPAAHEVTQRPNAWTAGDEETLDKITPLGVRAAAPARAERYMAGERSGHTLQTTAPVNQAYLRLVDCGPT